MLAGCIAIASMRRISSHRRKDHPDQSGETQDAVSGVRSSWLVSAKNSLLKRSASRRAEFAFSSSSSASQGIPLLPRSRKSQAL